MHTTIKYSLTSWVLLLFTIIQLSKFVNIHNNPNAQKLVFETGIGKSTPEDLLLQHTHRYHFNKVINQTQKFKRSENQTNINIPQLWRKFPTFQDIKGSGKCGKQSAMFMESLKFNEMWALQSKDFRGRNIKKVLMDFLVYSV